MSIKDIIREAMEKNPLGLREAVTEELRNRVSLALEAKMKESSHEDDEDDDDDEDEDDDDSDDEDDLDESYNEKDVVFKSPNFVVTKRDTKGGKGRQDPFSMFHIDNGKVTDFGSHPSLDGAKALAKKRGWLKESDVNESPKDEALTELSKNTLASYVKKAVKSKSMSDHGIERAKERLAGPPDSGTEFDKKVLVNRQRASQNRAAGITRASAKRESTDLDEAKETGDYARVSYNYSESWWSVTVYKSGKKAASDNGYFGIDETGNPLVREFLKLVKKAGLKPEGLAIVDEDGMPGVFKNNKFVWK
jgi:hypothetical protein